MVGPDARVSVDEYLNLIIDIDASQTDEAAVATERKLHADHR